MRVLIRGAGDIATGIALRLYRSHMQVVMTDLPAPTAIRRTVCFSQAIVLGRTEVEGVAAVLAADAAEAESLLAQEVVPVLADPDCRCRQALRPDAEVDAILAKRNLGTAITDAPVVIGIGPGFTAGADCHAVVETMRGHTLGRVIYEGSALPNTNIPGLIGGYAGERVLRAPADGIFIETEKLDLAGSTAGMMPRFVLEKFLNELCFRIVFDIRIVSQVEIETVVLDRLDNCSLGPSADRHLALFIRLGCTYAH